MNKGRLFLLESGGFLASIAPLVAVFVINWSRYAKSVPETVKLCFGGLIAAILILLKVLGRLKLPRRITGVTLVLILSYLLDAVLNDLTLLCAAYLCGELLSMLLFERRAKRLRERLALEKQAGVTADRVEQVLRDYIGSGRT